MAQGGQVWGCWCPTACPTAGTTHITTRAAWLALESPVTLLALLALWDRQTDRCHQHHLPWAEFCPLCASGLPIPTSAMSSPHLPSAALCPQYHCPTSPQQNPPTPHQHPQLPAPLSPRCAQMSSTHILTFCPSAPATPGSPCVGQRGQCERDPQAHTLQRMCMQILTSSRSPSPTHPLSTLPLLAPRPLSALGTEGDRRG